MLKFYNSPSDKRKDFQKLSPYKDTIVVSDLRAKMQIQKLFVSQYPVLPEEFIYRPSDLWKELARKYLSRFQLVGKEFFTSYLRLKLQQENEDWMKRPGVAKLLLQYLDQFGPIFAEESLLEKMIEWLELNPIARIKWGKWFLLAHKMWGIALKDKLLLLSWVPAILIEEEVKWHRNLTIDLGCEIRFIEAEFFKKISPELNVMLPNKAFLKSYNKEFQAYKVFENFHFEGEEVSARANLKFLRFPSMLSEVKDSVSWLRAQLEEGISISDLCLLAPDIGSYWPILSYYLKKEGIPYERAEKANVMSFPEIQLWLSELKYRCSEWTTGDLEQILFYSEDLLIESDRFQQVYSKIFDEFDLLRDKKVHKSFQSKKVFDSSLKLQVKEFIQIALSCFPEKESLERLKIVIEELLKDSPSHVRLDIKEWFLYLEQKTSKLEVQIEKAKSNALLCIDLSQIQSIDAKHLYVMGVTEDALRFDLQNQLKVKDRFQLENELGIILEASEKKNLEYILSFSLQEEKNFILSYPENDFNGKVLAPSVLWLQFALEKSHSIHEFNLPRFSRLDELQRQGIEQICSGDMLDRVLVDFGDKSLPNFVPKNLKRFSASRIEDYIQCPFVFVAKSLFHLSDLPNLDMDIDHLSRGKILHALLEEVVQEPFSSKLSQERILEILNAIRIREKIEVQSEIVWDSMCRKYQEITEQFLNFEKDWRQKFSYQTVQKEHKIHAFFDPYLKKFLPEKTEEYQLEFIAYIDRIDRDKKGNVLVFDYKSSKNDKIVNFQKWLEKSVLQLAIYSLLIEDIFLNQHEGRFLGSLYYTIKNWDRETGLLVQRDSDYPYNKKKSAVAEEQTYNLLQLEIREELTKWVKLILSGQFEPKPLDKKNCKSCKWRKLCRASHLI